MNITRQIFENYDSSIKPIFPGDVCQVNVTLYISSLSELDPVVGRAIFSVFTTLTWIDPILNWDPELTRNNCVHAGEQLTLNYHITESGGGGGWLF